jgi:hypothetical protein
MTQYTEREQVVEVINRLFYYTDYQQWDQLIGEVFAEAVVMDMTSLGASGVETLSSKQICENWKAGFKDLDAVHHQAGNHMIDIQGNEARVKSYAIASHFKKNTKNGTTREFIGSYDFHLLKSNGQWRIDQFRFNLKYMAGNPELT